MIVALKPSDCFSAQKASVRPASENLVALQIPHPGKVPTNPAIEEMLNM